MVESFIFFRSTFKDGNSKFSGPESPESTLRSIPVGKTCHELHFVTERKRPQTPFVPLHFLRFSLTYIHGLFPSGHRTRHLTRGSIPLYSPHREPSTTLDYDLPLRRNEGPSSGSSQPLYGLYYTVMSHDSIPLGFSWSAGRKLVTPFSHCKCTDSSWSRSSWEFLP